MNEMYKEMILQKNISDVSFIILNMKRAASSIELLSKRVSFPVYQEPGDQDIMKLLGGKKDDMLVYDRCGRLVDHFTMPQSFLDYPFVRKSLESVINRKSKCQQHCAATTTQTAPATSQTGSTNHTSAAPANVTSQPPLSSNNTTSLRLKSNTTALPISTSKSEEDGEGQ